MGSITDKAKELEGGLRCPICSDAKHQIDLNEAMSLMSADPQEARRFVLQGWKFQCPRCRIYYNTKGQTFRPRSSATTQAIAAALSHAEAETGLSRFEVLELIATEAILPPDAVKFCRLARAKREELLGSEGDPVQCAKCGHELGFDEIKAGACSYCETEVVVL